MKKKWLIVELAIFAVGALILLYPVVSSILARRQQAAIVAAYEAESQASTAEETSSQLLAAYNYNAALCQGKAPEDYDRQLADAEAMAYLEIPVIDVSLPVYHGTDEDTLKRGIGHMSSSSLPVGGMGTHCVLSAHNGLPGVTLFTPLDKLMVGDRFFLHVCGQTLAYTVDRILVVEPDDTSALLIDPTQDYVTLMTCTPYAVNTHRLLVRGVRVMDEDVETAEQVSAHVERPVTTADIAQWCAISAGVLLLVMLIVLLRGVRKGSKK
jgi:sortase A